MCPCQTSYVPSSLARSNRRETFCPFWPWRWVCTLLILLKDGWSASTQRKLWISSYVGQWVVWHVCMSMSARSPVAYRCGQVVVNLQSVFCLRNWILQNLPYVIIASQYFSPASLSQESGVWMRSTALGPEEEDCFSLSWELCVGFCDDVQCGAHIEQNRDGEIMIVWCSGGGENRECFWVIRCSVAWQAVKSYPTKDRKDEPLWVMVLPSPDWLWHRGSTEIALLDVFRKKLCCVDCTHVQTNIHPHQHHQESHVCPSVCWIQHLIVK